MQQATLGHRGRKGDPLYGIRRVLLRSVGRLGPAAFERMSCGLSVGDPEGEVSLAWLAKEDLRGVYAARGVAHARRRLTAFYQRCAEAEVPELTRLARTVSAWQDEVLAYHDAKLSNGRTEATNLLEV